MPGVTTQDAFLKLMQMLNQAVQSEVDATAYQFEHVLKKTAPSEIDGASIYVRTPDNSGYDQAVAAVAKLVRTELTQTRLSRAVLSRAVLTPILTREVPEPPRWTAVVASCINRAPEEFGSVENPGNFWMIANALAFHPEVGGFVRKALHEGKK